MRALIIIFLIINQLVISQDFSISKGTVSPMYYKNVTLGYKVGMFYGLLLGDRNLLILGPELTLLRRRTSIIFPSPPNSGLKSYISRSLINFPVFFAINTSTKPYENFDFFMKYGIHFGVQLSSCAHANNFNTCAFLHPSKNTEYHMGFSIGFEGRYYFKNKSYVGINFGGRMLNLFNDFWHGPSSNDYFLLESGIRYGFNFISTLKQ